MKNLQVFYILLITLYSSVSVDQCVEAYQYYKNVDMYYAYYQTPKSGVDSYLHCRGEDAHLAMPVNSLQAKILHEIQQKDPGHPTQQQYLGLARLGFQDIFKSNEFIAFTGEDIVYFYNKWATSEPSNFTNEDCVSMYNGTRTYHDTDCNIPTAFFCEKKGLSYNFGETYCVSDDKDYRYLPFSDMAYRIHLERKSWNEARKICQYEGGHLALIRSKVEENFLINLQKSYDAAAGLDSFLGFRDIFRRDTLITVTGEKFEDIGYSNWNIRQPKDYTKLCGGLNPNGEHIKMSCDDETIFFCQRKRTPSLM